MNNAKHCTKFIAYLFALLASYPVASNPGKPVELLPLADRDIAPSTSYQLNSTILKNTSQDDIAVSWPTTANAAEPAMDHTYLSTSRSYWKTVSAAQLKRGINITTTGRGAIVKIAPKTGNPNSTSPAPTLNIRDFLLFDTQGIQHRLQERVANSASFKELKPIKLGFTPGTLLFKLSDDLGHGDFTLKHKASTNEPGQFILYVFDKNSDHLVTMEIRKNVVFDNDVITVLLGLQGSESPLMPDSANAYLLGPGGQKIDMEITPLSKGLIEARARLQNFSAEDIGIWEVHANTHTEIDHYLISRNVKNIVAINRAGAMLTGKAEITRGIKESDSLSIEIGIENRSPGRYEIRGELYAHDSQGRIRPVMYGSSAGWREAGDSSIKLVFELLKHKADFHPPFELRNLRLYDQSRMMLLHKQSKAISFK